MVEVHGNREGVAKLNGFSPAMLKVFMAERDAEEWEEVQEDGEVKTVQVKEFNPISVMKKARLMKESFNGLAVVE
ncbi:hypothetical protein C0991_008085 [Blastosporella zonata]|nr:hypothetical protein C0991_008085 [Blastosporella zonata]